MKIKLTLLQFIIALLLITDAQAMNPFRKAFVFFAVHRDSTVIAVQSNPLSIADDSESNAYILTLTGVYTGTGGGGSSIPGFDWESGSTYGGVSSEGRIRATSVPETYWATNAQLYARFELRDSCSSLINSWDTPIYLRTIEHIEFLFLKNGYTEPQTIPGTLPSSLPDYDFKEFIWSASPKDPLTGATVSFNHTGNGRTTELTVSGTPAGGWAINDAPFDLTITSQSVNPDNVCVAEFKGLSWDGLETPVPDAQPKVTLRRLESADDPLIGYYWIRGQYSGGAVINSALPADVTATGVLQKAPYAGTVIPLDDELRLNNLGFTPGYGSSNQVVIQVNSDTNSFPTASSLPRLLAFREFDIDYATEYDWLLPYAVDPSTVPELERTLRIIGSEDAFAWSDFMYDFNAGTILNHEGDPPDGDAIVITWPYDGLVEGDDGTIDVTMKHIVPGFPESDLQVSVRIDGGACLPGDTDCDGILDGEDNCPYVPNETQEDSDADGVGDACDFDFDNDGVDDADDNCLSIPNPGQEDQDGDGAGDVCDADIDGDGVDNDIDNCVWTANAGQDDSDGDGQGDACDADDDNDGVYDVDDNCPLIANPSQDDADQDGIGDACDDDIDSDEDGIDNVADNCPYVPNPDQSDLDGDGIGDVCDDDIDGDGVDNETDVCESTPAGEIVEPSTGCSIDQLSPCEGPLGTTEAWKNHGKYVSYLVKITQSFVDQGLITKADKGAIVSEAAQSDCGDKK